MLGIGINASGRAGLAAAVTVVALAFSGCSTLYPESDPEPIVDVADVVIETPLELIEIKPLARQPWEMRLPPIAIVLTGTQAAYADVARELTDRFKDYEIYDLSDDGQPPVSVLRLINDSRSDVVVAIGLRAARS